MSINGFVVSGNTYKYNYNELDNLPDLDTINHDISVLKYASKEKYSVLPITWIENGYIDKDTGNVVEYSTWKYSDYIDISNLVNGYFIAINTNENTTGSSYNVFYDQNQQKVGSYFVINANLRPIPIPKTARYVRISLVKTEDAILYDDCERSKLLWYANTDSTSVLDTDFITLTEAKYDLYVPGGVEVSILQYAQDGTLINQSPYLGTRVYFRGNNVYKVSLRVKASSGNTLSAMSDSVKNITFEPKKIYNKIEYFKIMTYNVGLWYNGVDKLPNDMVASQSIKWHKMLGAYDPDVICVLEAPNKINVGGTSNYFELFSNKYPFKHNYGDSAAGVKAMGKNSIISPEKLTFNSGSNRVLYKFLYNVADIVVTVYVVHLSTEASTSGVRAQDLNQILGLMNGEEYAIVLGDFNTYDMSEITSRFSNYNICNGGIFGEFASWPHTREDWPNAAIDNIITTPNISIQNVELESEVLSDHMGLMATLNVYY